MELKPWGLFLVSIVCPIIITHWALNDTQLGPLLRRNPLLGLNSVLFILLDCGLYAISLIENSTWLIDPLWTIIPQLINLYFLAIVDSPSVCRSRIIFANALLMCWTMRLEHSYMRREGWRLGEREDWRYMDMRCKFKEHWTWLQFFLVELAQHGLLFGISLPLYYIYTARESLFTFLDFIAVVLCVSGLCLAKLADDRLYRFMQAKDNKRISRDTILQDFPWSLCRHPNYLGEITFWFGIALSGYAGGATTWMIFIGPTANALCLVVVATMVEERMLRHGRNSPSKIAKYTTYRSLVRSRIFPLIW